VLLLALLGYVVYLDRLVTRQFEGRRWTLPAQVYAAPLELYAGLPLTPADLEQELKRLHYRRAEQADHPGSYRVSGDQWELALRPARFADESRPAQLLAEKCRQGVVGPAVPELPGFALRSALGECGVVAETAEEPADQAKALGFDAGVADHGGAYLDKRRRRAERTGRATSEMQG